MENIQTTATRSLANSTARIKPRRAGVPCVRCRQMKVKCNASQRFPVACSACEKAGERCSVDPLFKRVSKRSVKHVSREASPVYRTPQSEVSSSEPTSVPPRSDGPCLDSLASVTAELRGGKRHARFTHGTTGINLWSGAVAELLEEYYANMHPRFPLLLDPATIIDSYEKAPLLFWTVVAIASKDSDKYASDYARLQILVRQLVADIILLGTRSIYLVQALLLLCAWSFPHTDMSKEPFSMYCSLAISMARSLGLHRPQHPYILFAAKTAEIGTLETRTSTWLSCFIIDQWHTSRFGVPSSIRIDHTVLHALNGSMTWLPATTKIQLHIALITSKISTALGECETSSTGLAPDPLPFIRMFESELYMIQDKFSSEWSPADEVSFLDARLSLYCYALGKKTEHPNTLHREKEHEMITQGTITCTQLLTIVTTFPDTLRKGTIHVFRSAGYAVFFLLRILGTAPSELIDGTNIRNIIRQTFTLMRQISQTSNDRRSQCMRTCRIIEHMLDCEDWNENEETPFLGKAESFMGMNFVADVAARGILKAYKYTRQAVAARMERERDGDGNHHSRQAEPAGVQSDAGSQFDLDFSIWDPMEWPVNWQDGDDFLFPSSSLGAS